MAGTLTGGIGLGQRPSLARAMLWPVALFAVSLGAAFGGALITGTDVGPIVGNVESLSSSSGSFLERVGTLFPLGFAFSAGMVSSVNPCGFAMLPAYLGLYLGDGTGDRAHPTDRLRRSMTVGGIVTLGFVLMFAAIGLPITLGARGIASFFPWIGFGVGILLAAAGAYMVGGGKLYTALGSQLSARIGDASQGGARGYFAFGLGYGMASLSCTLPIFLAVVGSTVTASTFASSMLQFALYGLGMGSVILALTLSMAIFRGAMVGLLRKALPYVQPISAVMLVLAGSFIVYYWLTIGGLLATLGLT
jgi:cytochrome c-type biogenesis protein